MIALAPVRLTFSVATRGALAAMLILSGGLAGCLGGGDSEGDRQDPDEVFLRLEERPLDLPRAPAGEFGGGCELVVGAIGLPGFPGEGALGPWPGLAALERGPVYVAHNAGPPRVIYLSAARQVQGSRWRAVEAIWISRPTYDGPVLVRGRRTDRPGGLRFGSGTHPSQELRLPAGDWPHRDLEYMVTPQRDLDQLNERLREHRDGWRTTAVPIRFRVAADEPGGCYTFQVDGLGFSYALPFGVQGE